MFLLNQIRLYLSLKSKTKFDDKRNSSPVLLTQNNMLAIVHSKSKEPPPLQLMFLSLAGGQILCHRFYEAPVLLAIYALCAPNPSSSLQGK